MRDLHGNIVCNREDRIQEGLGVLTSVRVEAPLNVDDDRQLSLVCGTEDLSHLLHVFGSQEINSGAVEVQFEPSYLQGSGAAVEFRKRVRLERIHAAKGDQAVRETPRLLYRPVILCARHPVFVLERTEVRIAKQISGGEHDTLPSPRGVQFSDQL